MVLNIVTGYRWVERIFSNGSWMTVVENRSTKCSHSMHLHLAPACRGREAIIVSVGFKTLFSLRVCILSIDALEQYVSAGTEKPWNDHPLSCRFRSGPIPRSLGCKPGNFFQLKEIFVPQNIPQANCATMSLPKNGWLGRRAGEECVMKCHYYYFRFFTTK